MNRANRLKSQQFHTPSYCLAWVDFRWDDSTLQRRIDLNCNNFTPPVIAYRKSISGETIWLCKRRFAMNWVNWLESSKNSHPSYCLLWVDFQGNDSTLQETFPTNWVASLSASLNWPKFFATFLERQMGIDFRWCGSTPNLVPRVPHLTAPWSKRRGR